MSEVQVEARNLEKAFGRTRALRGVSMSVAAGEVVAVTGPSGSGKSTLLLCLAGVLRPQSGQVVYDGARLDELSASSPRDSSARARSWARVFHAARASGLR